MNYEDFLVSPAPFQGEKWQLGHKIENELKEGGVALVFVSDYRGAGRNAYPLDFKLVREELYSLSGDDFDFPIYDLGDLISGKSMEDTQFVLQELLSACHYKNTIPLVIGGSSDLNFALYSALHFHQKDLHFTQISSKISLSNDLGPLSEENFLSRIFSSKQFSVQSYSHLAYQRHLNSPQSVKLMEEVDFEVLRLSELMGSAEVVEPFVRHAQLVSLNADSVESFSEPFSISPQVNGLNRREVCTLMKEIGLGENLRSMGLFNLEFERENRLNFQLISQMIWYFLEGLSIRKSHPKEKQFETFWVLSESEEYAFHKEVFSSQWYFGKESEMEKNLPCSKTDYEKTKRGEWPERLVRYLKRTGV